MLLSNICCSISWRCVLWCTWYCVHCYSNVLLCCCGIVSIDNCSFEKSQQQPTTIPLSPIISVNLPSIFEFSLKVTLNHWYFVFLPCEVFGWNPSDLSFYSFDRKWDGTTEWITGIHCMSWHHTVNISQINPYDLEAVNQHGLDQIHKESFWQIMTLTQYRQRWVEQLPNDFSSGFGFPETGTGWTSLIPQWVICWQVIPPRKQRVISWPVLLCNYGTALDWSVLDTSCWSGTLSQYPSSAWFIWNLFSFPPWKCQSTKYQRSQPSMREIGGRQKIDVGQS